MKSSTGQTTVDLTAGTRAFVATAADFVFLVGRSVLGADRVPTARRNAWEAVCADRKRAKMRADVTRSLRKIQAGNLHLS